MTSLGPISTGLLQNATFLQNAFITTFLTTLGVETVRNILGISRLIYKREQQSRL